MIQGVTWHSETTIQEEILSVHEPAEGINGDFENLKIKTTKSQANMQC
jgi:hypothetical protein